MSLSVAPGQKLGIVGESGSGKSTLARILLGLETPDAGSAQVAGVDWNAAHGEARVQARRSVQFISQDPLGSFDPRYTVGDIIAGLSAGSDAVAMFDTLKSRLQQPLSGMATSFSTSLFGLASSLVLGLIDLFAARAANRFYTEVEDWLSGMTRLSSGGALGEGEASVPAYVQALLEQTADGLERMQRALVDSERERRGGAQQMAELNMHLARLSEHLTRDSRGLAELTETQVEVRNALRALAQQDAGGTRLTDELRAEFRLLSRTLAAAVEGRH